jgi:hypothetical protein
LDEVPMLVALDALGKRQEASRELAAGQFVCPACHWPVTLKPGRKVVPHFAHRPGSKCALEGESREHLAAKSIIAARLRGLGMRCALEWPLVNHERRIDVATRVDGHKVAIEIQASPISVDAVKARTADHRRHGFVATAWVFVGTRAERLLSGDDEVRVFGEQAYLSNRYHRALNVLDLTGTAMGGGGLGPAMWRVELDGISREGSEYYVPDGRGETDWSPGYSLTRTFAPTHSLVGFVPVLELGRYSSLGKPDWHLGFR